jgi:alkylation response protein AidB-like acyl-CoA dehydrogenase
MAQLSPADETVRDEVRSFFAAELTPDLRRAGQLMTSVYADHESQMAWQVRFYAMGWAALAWPAEHGGCRLASHIRQRTRPRRGAAGVADGNQAVRPGDHRFRH